MRHLKSGRKLNRSPSHRRALLRNLAISLLEHERIITTREKAKEVQRFAERLINLGKKGGLHNLRLALARLPHKPTVMKLFHDIGPRYSERARVPGGSGTGGTTGDGGEEEELEGTRLRRVADEGLHILQDSQGRASVGQSV